MSDERGPSKLKKIISSTKLKLGGVPQLAADIYKSGRLDTLRKERIEQGIPPWSVLRYRHVLRQEETPVPLHPMEYVLPETFEAHLQYISSHCTPIPLPELIARAISGEELPERAVALTFDYGHADVYLNAFPLLVKYQVPATVCLATAYVDSESYLPDDRLTLALIALKKIGKPLPQLECFPADFYAELGRLSKGLEITPPLMARYLETYRTLDEELRALILESLTRPLSEVVMLPEYEDFLRWEDVKKMKEYGVSFATMGTAGLVATGSKEEVFLKDITHSVKDFLKHSVAMEKFLCLPEGAYASEHLEELRKLGFRVVVSIGDFPKFQHQEKEPFIVGRIKMFERAGETIPLFACRLFRIETEDFAF